MKDLRPPKTIDGTPVMVIKSHALGCIPIDVILIPVDLDDDRTWEWVPSTGKIKEIDP